MTIYWLKLTDVQARGFWDQGLLEDIFADEDNQEVSEIPKCKEAIVVIAGRYYVDLVSEVNEQLRNVEDVTLIVTSDEESLFPFDKINHPNYRLYLMTPRFDRKYKNVTKFLGEGYPPHMKLPLEPPTKDLDFFFSGQITHDRRQKLKVAMDSIEEFKHDNQLEGVFNATPGFTKGLKPEDYYKEMMRAEAVPCPAGPATPDSFRLFEALECGAVPIADSMSPSNVINYWQQLYPDAPFPIFDDYDTLQGNLRDVRDQYPVINNKCLAWWMRYKIDLKDELLGYSADKDITILMPTSPTPSNPSTAIIEETIESVRYHLPNARIILMIDGVREEQQDRLENYNEYVRRLLWVCNRKFENIYPMLFEEHTHQAGMTKEALKLVKTPQLLFVEHDTPLTIDREIEWDGLKKCIENGRANVMRLCHEELILPDYQHMVFGGVQPVCGVQAIKTAQWSQRPHLASTAFYRDFIDKYFRDGARTMIEDVMHGVVHNAYIQEREMGWNLWRVWVYHPDTDKLGIKRSLHLDGRGSDEKFEMVL